MYLTAIFQIIIICDAHAKNSVSFYLYFCYFWINVTQINFENIKRKIQRIIIYDSCFQLKSWFNVDARAPSIPLLNFPFKLNVRDIRCKIWLLLLELTSIECNALSIRKKNYTRIMLTSFVYSKHEIKFWKH